MLTAVASDDGDRAPALTNPVNGTRRILNGAQHGRGYAAWQVMFDELADGEWHSQRELTRAAQIEISGYGGEDCKRILSLAVKDSRIQREYRTPSPASFDRKPEPWYRRNREETPDA